MLYQLSYAHHITAYYFNMLPLTTQVARPAGFEPATTRLEGGCSIRLSYGRLASLQHTEVTDLRRDCCPILLDQLSYPASGFTG